MCIAPMPGAVCRSAGWPRPPPGLAVARRRGPGAPRAGGGRRAARAVRRPRILYGVRCKLHPASCACGASTPLLELP